MDKATLRKQMRALKAELSPERKSALSDEILRQVEQSPIFNNARVVLLYWSMADEVQTHAFVDRWYRRKTLLLPCVDGNDLRLRQYTGLECMVEGEQFGIGEPTGTEFSHLEEIEVIIVPGVAFDHMGNRMGRGRGFYDRLLRSTPNAVKIGIGFDFQLLQTIPTETHDIAMDYVVTPSHFISKQVAQP